MTDLELGFQTIADFSGVLREKEESIAKQKALNSEMKKMHEEQLARSETINAFKHTELATAAHWSSLTASVARRRGAGLPSSQRGYSQSQSQSVAAAVGLTTPTRRNRGATRNLGSGEGASDRGTGSGGGDRSKGEDSPSSRKSLLRQQRQEALSSAKVKTPAFPGFVNSFAKPALQTPRSAPKGEKPQIEKDIETQDDDGAVFQDDSIIPRVEVEPMQVDQACGPGSSLDVGQVEEDRPQERGEPNGWSNPQYRYIWAVTTYSKQLSFISSLILSHSSVPCLDDDSTPHALSHSSTLYRLLNASLPAHTPVAFAEEYVVLTHMLLNILSQGAATDAEGRFAYLLNKTDYESQEDLSDDDRQREEQQDFWECQTVMNEGVSEVLEGIASILCCMMIVSLRSGMTQRLYDIFVLMRSICIHEPSMVHALLYFDPSAHKISSAESTAANSQASRVARLPPAQMNIVNVVVVCIRELSGKGPNREGSESNHSRLEGEAGERLVQASLGLIDMIAHQGQSNDQYS
jgi:hypothetical protein